jgi:ferric-dicitrate binding protein FerR (iron transport regulator)
MKIKNIFYKYYQGIATQEEERQVMDYVDSSEKARNEFLRERKLWDAYLLNTDLDTEQLVSALRTSKHPFMVRYFSRIAAIFILGLLSTALAWHYLPTKNTDMLTMQTPLGGQTELTLSDGSRVHLNGGTTLSYPVAFGKKTRLVEITGEGYFEVTKSNIPFIVKSNHYEVKVMGTSFNVHDYEDETLSSVALIEGSVKVQANDVAKQEIVLKPGERIVLDKQSLTKENISNYDVFLWRDGFLVFDDNSLRNMIGAMEKYYNVRLIVSNTDFLDYKCTGKFIKSEGVDHLLKVLRKSIRFTYKHLDDNTIEIQ